MEKFIIPLVLALALGYLLTPWVRALAFKMGALDNPDPRKVHNGIMPRMGGLAVYIAFVAAVLMFRELTPQVWGLLAGSTVIMLVGVLDDIRGVSPRIKLAGQILAALIVIIPFKVQIDYITNPLTGQVLILHDVISIPLTVFWIVAVTNAVNLIDGLDGLAGGVSSIAALTMAAVTWTQWGSSGSESIMLALTLAVAVVGFLRYNFHPAKIFLGDTGSLFLGFTLSVMAIMGLTKSATFVPVIIPLVILGVPLSDTFFAIIRRYNKHQPIFQPDREHLHHQLMNMGFSHRQTVLALYGLSAFLGLNAVVLNMVSTNQAMVLLIILVVVAIYFADRVGVLGRRQQSGYGISDEYQQRSSKM